MSAISKTFILLIQLFILLVLPFILLIRGAVFLYVHYQWHLAPSLLLTMLVVFCLLVIYLTMLYQGILGKKAKVHRKSLKIMAVLALLMLMAYTGWTLFSLSGNHSKSPEVHMEYLSLHPLLRIAVGTIVLLDEDLLITDLSRGVEDYRKMGLPSPKHSLHFRQGDGFAHAMDIRTRDRSALRNGVTRWYFRLMGFNTLRHVGTADHLHISLPDHDHPGAL